MLKESLTILVLLNLALVYKTSLVTTCKLQQSQRSTAELIINYQENLLNNLSLDKNYEVVLLNFVENTHKSHKKAVFQILNSKFEVYYIGIIFEIKSKRPIFDTYIQSKDKTIVAKTLGLGKYQKSIICPKFKRDLKQNFQRYIGFMKKELEKSGDLPKKKKNVKIGEVKKTKDNKKIKDSAKSVKLRNMNTLLLDNLSKVFGYEVNIKHNKKESKGHGLFKHIVKHIKKLKKHGNESKEQKKTVKQSKHTTKPKEEHVKIEMAPEALSSRKHKN